MYYWKRFLSILTLCLVPFFASSSNNGKEVVVYVTSWSEDIPDPSCATVINYAFAHVNATFDGVDIDNMERLRTILDLKKQNPDLKVVLSVGGWKSGGFSEMASDARNRRVFAWNCRKLIWNMGLDGIDIDWEYPTTDVAGISALPEDTRNFTLLMKELRTIIGPKRLLTFASVSSAEYINYREVAGYVDYVNVMTYDMGLPPFHNAPLYNSKYVQNISVADAVRRHLDAGIPKDKLVLGVPFYGHGVESFPAEVKNTEVQLVSGYFYNWDDDAKVPYLTDRRGSFAYSYDDVRSLELKCQYIVEQGLRGVMCWSNEGDDEEGTLLGTVFNGVTQTPQ